MDSTRVVHRSSWIPFVVALAAGASTSCSASLEGGLAGTWLVTRTLVTEVQGLPNGYQDQQEWTFTTSGKTGKLTSAAGSVDGTFDGTWVFATQYTDPRVGLPATLRIEIIGVDPLKGTLENNLFDPTGFRPPNKEAFQLEGVRK
jgi:hypothetical protein